MKRVLHMRFLLLMFLALGLMVDRIGPWNTVGALKQCLNRKASTITCPIGFFLTPISMQLFIVIQSFSRRVANHPNLFYCYIGILVVRKEYNTGECDPPPENLPEGVKKGLHHTVQAFDQCARHGTHLAGESPVTGIYSQVQRPTSQWQ